jgi:hypothetical protein
MPAIFDRVLTLNLVANTAIFYVAARLYLLPLIPRVRPQRILVPILLLHATRHLGLMFLTVARLTRECRRSLRIRPRLAI